VASRAARILIEPRGWKGACTAVRCVVKMCDCDVSFPPQPFSLLLAPQHPQRRPRWQVECGSESFFSPFSSAALGERLLHARERTSKKMRPPHARRGRPLLVVLAASLLLHLSLLLLLLALPAAVVVAAPAASRATAPPTPTPRPASKPLPASSSLLTPSDVRPAPCEPGACKQGRCGFRDCPAGTTVTCRGGGCLFENVADATCDGGGCRFVGCGRGDCRGGGCDFTAHSPDHALDEAFCDGGGCTIDGYAARSNARSFKACEWTRRKGEGERGRGGGGGDVLRPVSHSSSPAHSSTSPLHPAV
jgi:hypothetical protein